nr:hypothetical protein [Tanacetum cinerariifolium]
MENSKKGYTPMIEKPDYSKSQVGVVRGLLQKEVREKTCYGKWAGKVSNMNSVLNCQGDRDGGPKETGIKDLFGSEISTMMSPRGSIVESYENVESFFAVHTPPNHLIRTNLKQERVIPKIVFHVFEKLVFLLGCHTLGNEVTRVSSAEQSRLGILFGKEILKGGMIRMHYAFVHNQIRPEFFECIHYCQHLFFCRSVIRFRIVHHFTSIMNRFEVFLMSLPQDRTYGEIACVAHKFKGQVPGQDRSRRNFRMSKRRCDLVEETEMIMRVLPSGELKEAQIKLYKTREDKELNKVIELENKVKVLDNIVYKTGQSVQTMNMLNNKCQTSFAKPEFLKKGQRANPRLCLNEETVADLRYFNSLESEVDSLRSQLESQKTQFLNEIDRLSREYYYADHINTILGVYNELDEASNLQCDYLELLEKCEGLETEHSKSKMMSNSFESDLKAQLQDKSIVISKMKKLIEKLKGKSVDTKFKKSSVIRQPNAFKRVIPTTSVSRPQFKSNPQGDRVMHNNSRGKKQEIEDQRKNVKFSKNKTSVTTCNDSLNTKTLNVKFLCATCDTCVLIDKHDMCVLKSVAKPSKETVASESNKKPRNFTRKLYERVSMTCSWWYSKFTPAGYKWKPKSGTENVNPNVSMPLENASRTANVMDTMTFRRSTVSNTPLSSNSFAARRDCPIHRRLWVLKAHDGKSQACN